MKIGVISNSALCVPLLSYLKSNNITTNVYCGTSTEISSNNSLQLFCNAHNISFENEKNKAQLYTWLKQHQPDYSFIIGYRNLIYVERLENFKDKIFNIHTGKLPEYRGASPIFWQLKNGAESIGLTIHLLNSKLDTGPLIWSKNIPNEPHITFGLVEFLFSNFIIEGVFEILNKNFDDLHRNAIEQDESIAVYYKTPGLQDVLINWKQMSAFEIVNLVKACNPWNKGAITVYNNMEVKIIDAEVVNTDSITEQPGTILNNMIVACTNGSSLKINMYNINGIFVPSRFGDKYGLVSGGIFKSN